MERSASAHVRDELVARLVHEGVAGAALQEAVDDVPVDVPLSEVDDEFYAVPELSGDAGDASEGAEGASEAQSQFGAGGHAALHELLPTLREVDEDEPRVLRCPLPTVPSVSVPSRSRVLAPGAGGSVARTSAAAPLATRISR